MYNSIYPGQSVASLSAVSTAQAGTVFSLPVKENDFVWWSFVPGSSAPTSVSVALEMSSDGTNWIRVDCWANPTYCYRRVEAGSSRFVRANLLAISGGDPVTINIMA